MKISIAIKIPYTLFAIILVPMYWKYYGPTNFLWISGFAMLTTVVALWIENRTIASMMMVSAFLPDTLWSIDYFWRLFLGSHLIGGTEYMFDLARPLYLRNISLYHVFLPPILLLMLVRLGYDKRALFYQTGLFWVICLTCYFFTDPEKNINYVFGPFKPQDTLHPLLYLALLMGLTPLCVYYPLHRLLDRLFGDRPPP